MKGLINKITKPPAKLDKLPWRASPIATPAEATNAATPVVLIPTYSKTTKTTRPFKITSKNVSKNDLIVTSTFLLSRVLFNMLTIF